MQVVIGVTLTALAVGLVQTLRPRNGVERPFMQKPGAGATAALLFTMLFATGLIVTITGLTELL